MKKKDHNVQKERLAVQIIALLAGLFLFLMLNLGRFISAHQYCPYAPVCFGFPGILGRGISYLIYPAILAGLVICLFTMFFGRKFCGYLCPLGTVQEGLFRLRSKKYRLRQIVPYYLQRKLNTIKYIFLALTSVLAILGIAYFYMRFCPVLTLSSLQKLIWQGGVILVVIFGSALLIDRFWCRYLCPFAALLNIFQCLGHILGHKRQMVYRNLEQCNDCGVCVRFCPMNINVSEFDHIEDLNCIHCLKCLDKCPKGSIYKFYKA